MIAHALSIRQPALLSTGQPMLLDIPDCDYDEWKHDVGRKERARLREIFCAFKEMLAARSIKAGAASAALKRHHLGRGWSAKSLKNLFALYRDGGYKPGDTRKQGPRFAAGDWRALLHAYSGIESAAPEEFKRWLCEQWAQFRGRTDCIEATWRHVVYQIWLKGKPVPGYGTIDDWCQRTGRARPHPDFVRNEELPEGWSLRTFRRHLPKRRVVQQQVAHGYLAAHNAQPDQVLTDRSPLMPLQYVFIDDSRPDFRCSWFGPGSKGQIVYPLLVMGLDAACGVDLGAVTKPRALKDESEAGGAKRHGVTQDMALRVVLSTLGEFGLPPWQMVFVHENAAGCVPAEARHALVEMYGDRIGFESTGIFRQRMLEHGFSEQGGAPWDKAPIESFWRLLMTQLARLQGATGPRYDTAPGELAQLEDYTLNLMKQAGGMESVFKLFESPLLDWPEADAAIMSALRMLRFRIGHKLQGFDRVREWRRSPADRYHPWKEFLALPVDEQNAIGASGDKGAIISRIESPAERFCRKLQGVQMTPVDPDFLAFVQGPREPVRVINGKIVVKRVALGDDAMIFREEDHPLLAEEYERRQLEGVILNGGERILLAEEGRILGAVAQQGRVVRGTDAWRREMGRVAAARVADREHLRGYLLADTDAALADLRARNEAVLASPQLMAAAAAPAIQTTAKKQSAADKARNKRLADHLAAKAASQHQGAESFSQ
jgi:hypothetical protein